MSCGSTILSGAIVSATAAGASVRAAPAQIAVNVIFMKRLPVARRDNRPPTRRALRESIVGSGVRRVFFPLITNSRERPSFRSVRETSVRGACKSALAKGWGTPLKASREAKAAKPSSRERGEIPEIDGDVGAALVGQLDRIALFLTDEPLELQAEGLEDFCLGCARAFRSRGMESRSARRAAAALGERLLTRICYFELTRGNA
jgi:hypothetical protein